MTRDPDNLDALLRELLVERYSTTNRDIAHRNAILDTPEAFACRQRILNDAMADTPDNVVPLNPDSRRVAA